MDNPAENIIEINDIDLITELVNRSFITVADEYGYTMENASTFPAFIGSNVIANDIKNGLIIFGYKKDGEVIGCCGHSKHSDIIYKIKRLAVLPEYRHYGIGKRLMAHNELIIKENGGSIAEVHLVNNNEKLKRWYTENNYREIAIEEVKGLPFKVCIMQKEL